MKQKLPIRPVGAYTVNFYNSFQDCVDRLPHEGNLMEAVKYAQEMVHNNPLYHSYSVDRRVANSLTNTWNNNNG